MRYCPIKRTVKENPYANPLPRLQPGRWISSGHVLDYEYWPDRDRFLELDQLIIQVDQAERQERILWLTRPWTPAGPGTVGARLAQDFSESSAQIAGASW